jgi:hypothetical protein
MRKKKIAINAEHGYIGEVESKRKPVKPYIEPAWLVDYRLKRDRVIWQNHPESRNEIELKHGITRKLPT